MSKLSKYSYVLLLTSIIVSNITYSEITLDQEKLLEQLPPDQREAIRVRMMKANEIEGQINEAFEEESTLVERPEKSDYINMQPLCDDCIYGQDIFQFAPSTFAPSNNISISADYILGPGDKLSVSFFGSNDDEAEAYISREGIIVLPKLGPLNFVAGTM